MPHVHDYAARLAGLCNRTAGPASAAPPIAARVPRAGGSPRVVIVGLWQLLSSPGVIDERTIASPAQIARPRRRADPGRHPRRRHPGLAAAGRRSASLIGAVDRLVAWRSSPGSAGIGENAVDPPMQMLRTLPHFGLIPLFILWFGIGETPKIALIALGVAFPLYLNTFAGIRSVDRKITEAAARDAA